MDETGLPVDELTLETALPALEVSAVLRSDFRAFVWPSAVEDCVTSSNIHGIVIEVKQLLLNYLLDMRLREATELRRRLLSNVKIVIQRQEEELIQRGFVLDEVRSEGEVQETTKSDRVARVMRDVKEDHIWV